MRRIGNQLASGIEDRDIFIRCLQLGVFGYLVKPFSDTQLLINVISALERRRLKQEIRKLRKAFNQ